jgi:hypothetical protein
MGGGQMNLFKKATVFLCATIGAVSLAFWALGAYGFGSPIFALLINWLAMSWAAIVGQVVPFSLPAGFYEIRVFESTGRIYEGLGIRFFKKLVRRGPLSIFSPTLRLPHDRSVETFRFLEQETRKAETAHLFVFLLMMLLVSWALLGQWFGAMGWLMAFNLLLNGYPIMLQRYNRIKLQRLLRINCV